MHCFYYASYKAYIWDPSFIFSDFLKFCFAFVLMGVFTATVFNNDYKF